MTTTDPDRSRWAALVVLCTGMLMIVLDVTVVNVALPSIQDDLGFSQSSLAWVVNAYLITFGGLLVAGSLMLLVYTIVKRAVDYGWGSPRTLGLGAGALALLVAFVVREATAANPLMPLGVFRSRNVAGANAVQALLVPGMFG